MMCLELEIDFMPNTIIPPQHLQKTVLPLVCCLWSFGRLCGALPSLLGDIYRGASLSCFLLPRYLLRSLTQACLPQFKLLVLWPLLTIGLCPSIIGKTVSVVTFLLCWKSYLIFMLLWMGHSQAWEKSKLKVSQTLKMLIVFGQLNFYINSERCQAGSN